MNIKKAIKEDLQIRKVERFYAIDNQGNHWELPREAQLLYGVAWKRMPKKKRTKT